MVSTLLEQYLDALTGQDFLLVVVLAALGFGIGLLIEKVLVKNIAKLLYLIPRQFGKSFIDSLKYLFIFWGTAYGVYLALERIGMGPKVTFAVRETFIVLGILSFGLAFSRFLAYRISYKASDSSNALVSTSIFVNIARICVFVISILVALKILNVPIGPALTALGVGGIAVALALKDTLENFFGGLQLIFSKQVRIGNYIMLSTGEEGHVRDITWRNTSIETPEDATLIIPNSKLSAAYVTNCSVNDSAVIAKVKMMISAYADVKKVESLMRKVATDVQNNSKFRSRRDFTPAVRIKDLSNVGQEWEILVLCKKAEFFRDMRHEVLSAVIESMQKEGIPLLPVAEDRVFASRNDISINQA